MRTIFDYELIEYKDGSYYITVVSALPEEVIADLDNSETGEKDYFWANTI